MVNDLYLYSLLAIPSSISDDWSSTGFLEANQELESSMPDRERFREKRDKERQKERAKVEKEKESDEGKKTFMSGRVIALCAKRESPPSKYCTIRDQCFFTLILEGQC
jgi:hypothetical protein